MKNHFTRRRMPSGSLGRAGDFVERLVKPIRIDQIKSVVATGGGRESLSVSQRTATAMGANNKTLISVQAILKET